MPPKLLAIHRRPVLLRRGSSDVDEPRAGADVDFPAGLLEPPAQVHLLVEHEEGRIEDAHLVESLAAE
jgi:hypothetical protein